MKHGCSLFFSPLSFHFAFRKKIFCLIELRPFNIERLVYRVARALATAGESAGRKSPPAVAAERKYRTGACLSSRRIAAREQHLAGRRARRLRGQLQGSLPASALARTPHGRASERASESASELAYLSIIPLEILERVWYHRPYSLGSVS